ncbi:hypothetical protein BT67DRAFT_103801 [Trichocladium antarcticum]|uniref:Uncharacterized protein n=1 Tax=Trichocladium antarcticum TaxID=1450529 RepID=A0AAN6UQI6_9PEZI|nr:hypothetical protein BT67DRAFT_103801 [Trichocladium antarcticum]
MPKPGPVFDAVLPNMLGRDLRAAGPEPVLAKNVELRNPVSNNLRPDLQCSMPGWLFGRLCCLVRVARPRTSACERQVCVSLGLMCCLIARTHTLFFSSNFLHLATSPSWGAVVRQATSASSYAALSRLSLCRPSPGRVGPPRPGGLHCCQMSVPGRTTLILPMSGASILAPFKSPVLTSLGLFASSLPSLPLPARALSWVAWGLGSDLWASGGWPCRSVFCPGSPTPRIGAMS